MYRPPLVTVLALSLSAWQLAAQDADAITTFRSDTRLVMLHATVVDSSGRLVTDLPQSAFDVFENGVEQPLKVFRREDAPISLGLIIDSSATMQDKRSHVEAAALDLIRASHPEDEVFILKFNEEAVLAQPFTTKIPEMQRGLSKVEARGGTAMRDALRTSLEYLKRNGNREKKVLLVITDGADNSSSTTLDNLVRAAQDSEVVVHTIGLLSSEEKREAERAKRALLAITEATGGQAFFPTEISEVRSVALQVARDIRNQYVLAYSPTDSKLDGSYRKVRVVVDVPNGATVRTRAGYFAAQERRSN